MKNKLLKLSLAVIIAVVLFLGINLSIYADHTEGESIAQKYGVTEIGNTGVLNWNYQMGETGVAYTSAGGWNTVEPGVITRENKFSLPLHTTSDIFVLNGMSLVYVSGTNPRIYHAEKQTYKRILYYNSTSPSTSYWLVINKDGTKTWYGYDPDETARVDSRIMAVGKGKVRCWAAAKVKDATSNNIIKYVYTGDYAGNADSDYYLSKVISGKSGASLYHATLLTNEPRENTILSFSTGSRVRINERLKEVTLRAGTNISGGGGTFVKKYGISYHPYADDGGFEYISSIKEYGNNGTSSLAPVSFEYEPEEPEVFGFDIPVWWDNCPGDGLVGKILSSDIIQLMDMNGDNLPDMIYRNQTDNAYVAINNGNGFNPVQTWGNCLGVYFYEKVLRRDTGTGLLTLDMRDMNGDGRPDMIYRNGTDYMCVAINNGNGFNGVQHWNNCLESNIYTKVLRQYNAEGSLLLDLVDMNGDGRPDMIHRNGTDYMSVAINNGGGFNAAQQWSNCLEDNIYGKVLADVDPNGGLILGLMDMNGDGLPDMIYRNGTGSMSIAVNSSYGFYTAQTWYNCLGVYLWEKVLRSVILSSGSVCLDLKDMNGDGRPDMIYRNSANNLTVAINNGSNGFNAAQSWSNSLGGSTGYIEKVYNVNEVNESVYLGLIDMNGDNLPDMVYRNVTQDMQIALNNGNGFDSMIPWGNCPGDSAGSRILDSYIVKLIDMDDDGQTDMVCRDHTLDMQVATNTGEDVSFPRKITQIKNPIGGTTSYNYVQAGEYYINDNIGNIRLLRLWVVDSVNTNNGLGNIDQTQYSYAGAVYDEDEKDFRGFGTVTKTDPNGNKTETHYFQDKARAGLVKKAIVRDSSNYIHSYTYNTYEDYAATHSSHYGYNISQSRVIGPSVNVYAECLTQSKNYVVDGSTTTDNGTAPGGTWKLVNQTFSYNNYGNPLTVETSGSGYDKKKTTNAYAISTSNWVFIPCYKKIEGTNSESATYYTQFEERYYFDNGTAIGTWLPYGSVTQGALKAISVNNGTEWVYKLRVGYDSYGNPTTKRDALGNDITMTYDTAYRKYFITKTDEEGFETTCNYNSLCELESGVDINGQIVYFEYDVFGRKTSETQPGDTLPTVETVYYFNGTAPEYTVTRKRDTSGTLDTYTYVDGFGKTVQVKTEGLDNETARWITIDQWEYFNSPKLIKEVSVPYFTDSSSYSRASSPTGNRTKTENYLNNSLGNVSKETKPDGTIIYKHSQRFVVTKRNENGYGVTVTVDALGNEIEEKVYSDTYPFDTLYSTNKMYYDTGTGKLIKSIEDYNGADVETTYEYDLIGRVKREIDPDKGTWQYFYDANGNITEQIDAELNSIEYTYDALNRKTKTTFPGTGNYIEYTYDYYNGYEGSYANSKLARARVYEGGSKICEDGYKYDVRGNKIGEYHEIDGVGKEFVFTYDSMNRVVTIEYPDGEIVTNTYNTAGNLETVIGASNYVQDMDYSTLEKLIYRSYGNGVATNYDYYDTGTENDPSAGTYYSYRLRRISTTDTSIQDIQYEYDKTSNVMKKINQNNASYSETYGYDTLNRLISANATVYGSISYQYDEIDNITSKNGVSYVYGSSRPHAVTSRSDGIICSYDDNGNMTSKSTGASQNIKVGSNYYSTLQDAYDAASSGATLLCRNIVLDGDISTTAGKTITVAGGYNETFSGIDGRTTLGGQILNSLGSLTFSDYVLDSSASEGSGLTFTYDGGNRLISANDAQYFYGSNGNRVRKIENGVTTRYFSRYYEEEGSNNIKYYYANGVKVAKRSTTDGLVYYHKDHLDSSTVVTNSSGTVVKDLGYMPYGNDSYSSGTVDIKYKFTGKEKDDTGLYYYGARYYDPELARFISVDAMGDNYTYCHNNPLTYVDPTGNFAIKWNFSEPPQDRPNFEKNKIESYKGIVEAMIFSRSGGRTNWTQIGAYSKKLGQKGLFFAGMVDYEYYGYPEEIGDVLTGASNIYSYVSSKAMGLDSAADKVNQFLDKTKATTKWGAFTSASKQFVPWLDLLVNGQNMQKYSNLMIEDIMSGDTRSQFTHTAAMCEVTAWTAQSMLFISAQVFRNLDPRVMAAHVAVTGTMATISRGTTIVNKYLPKAEELFFKFTHYVGSGEIVGDAFKAAKYYTNRALLGEDYDASLRMSDGDYTYYLNHKNNDEEE